MAKLLILVWYQILKTIIYKAMLEKNNGPTSFLLRHNL